MNKKDLWSLTRLCLSYFRDKPPTEERTISRGKRAGRVVTNYAFKGRVTLPFSHGRRERKKVNILIDDDRGQRITSEHMDTVASHLALEPSEVSLSTFILPVADAGGLFFPQEELLQASNFEGKAVQAIADLEGVEDPSDLLEYGDGTENIAWMWMQLPGWVLGG